MTVTGRTIKNLCRLVLDNSAGALSEIPIDSVNGVGTEAAEKDVSAWQDAIKNSLLETPSCKIDVTGPFDNRAAVAASASTVAPALSGSVTILKDLVGRNVPLAFGVLFGMPGAYYTTGDPAFGLNVSAGLSGFICSKFTVDLDAMKYSASFVVYGQTAPSWINALPTS